LPDGIFAHQKMPILVHWYIEKLAIFHCNFVSFMTIWNFLGLFGKFCCHFVHFTHYRLLLAALLISPKNHTFWQYLNRWSAPDADAIPSSYAAMQGLSLWIQHSIVWLLSWDNLTCNQCTFRNTFGFALVLAIFKVEFFARTSTQTVCRVGHRLF
jgi:hypothetical protein